MRPEMTTQNNEKMAVGQLVGSKESPAAAQALDIQNVVATRLLDQLELLTNRLRPITAATPRNEETQSSKPGNSDLVNAINGNTNLVEQAISTVNYLLATLEV